MATAKDKVAKTKAARLKQNANRRAILGKPPKATARKTTTTTGGPQYGGGSRG